jgi:hypothetical protein
MTTSTAHSAICFFEYNWTSGVWGFRIADRWTAFRDTWSWQTLDEVKSDVAAAGLVLVKTDSRTYALMCPTAA